MREWKNNPLTELIFRALRNKREELKEITISGAGTHPTAEATAISLAHNVGLAEAIEDILEISADDINTMLEPNYEK